MVRKFILIIYFLFNNGSVLTFAQTHRICATTEHDKYLRSVNPEYAKERDETENKIASYIAAHSSQRNEGTTLVIPVVVHIVWNTPDQNLSDEQIVSQIDVLNEDYTRTNANIVEVPSVWTDLVGSTNLYFSLARQDEDHNPTNGITRTQTTATSFSTDDGVKFTNQGGYDGWDCNHFLNIWVCNLQNGGSQDILGYGQYPTNTNSATDGIVVNYQAFGRTGTNLKPQYNIGRTTTHEIGHWLNLYHTWGDDGGACSGTDQIEDTPNQADATYGCPAFPHISCSNSPNGDMFEDYMDYTDDRCMMLFSADQRSRMDAAINLYRDTLYSAYPYTLPVSELATDLKISNLIVDTNSLSNVVCEKYINPLVTVENTGMNTINSFQMKYGIDNDSLQKFAWSGILVPGANIDITLPQILISEDLHVFSANIDTVNGGGDEYTPDNFKTRGFLYSPDKYTCPVYPETPEISILPNPANESVSIETKYKTAQKATLSIYNILGKKIFSKDYLNTHGQVINADVAGLANGIYLAEVKTFDKQESKKFVVNHL